MSCVSIMYSIQDVVVLNGPDWLNAVVAATVFLSAVVLSAVFNKLFFPLILKITRRTRSDLGGRTLVSVRVPISCGFVVIGGYLGLHNGFLQALGGNRAGIPGPGGLALLLLVGSGEELLQFIGEFFGVDVLELVDPVIGFGLLNDRVQFSD